VQVVVIKAVTFPPKKPHHDAERQRLTRRFLHLIGNVHVSIDQSGEERATSPVDYLRSCLGLLSAITVIKPCSPSNNRTSRIICGRDGIPGPVASTENHVSKTKLINL
jgi:hypothetical protein